MRRFLRWGLFALSALVALRLAVFVWEEPIVAAWVCPSCLGFEEAAEGVYVNAGMTDADRADLLSKGAAGRSRVAEFYGTLGPQADLFVCDDAECDARMGYRGAKARAFGSRFILIFSQGRTATFLAHEMAHVELAHRIGLWATMRNRVPAWFNEGLAVLIAGDERFFARNDEGEPACVVRSDGAEPVTMTGWSRAMRDRERPLYAMAACRTITWMEASGQRGAVLSQLEDVAGGAPFADR